MVRHDLVSIVILTYNQIDYTRLCLDSLRLFTTWPYELIMVDNGSTDGTVEYLRSLPDVKLILNEENLGFARGCNQGMALAEGEFVLLLNNDTVLTQNWLENLVECARSSPDVGMVGPRSNYVSGDQWLDTSYTTLEEMQAFARGFNQGGSHLWFEVTRLIGFCLLIKREVIDRVGYLDEDFGLGCYEDDDYSVRVRRAGYRLMVAGNTFVHHFGNRTFVGNNIDMYQLLDENRSKFMRKWSLYHYYHWPRPELVSLVPPSATRVLDVDCGAGIMGQELKKRGVSEVVGIEINLAIAEEARSRLDRVLVGDVEAMELPFAEDYFDAIVYSDVLEHLEDPWALLSRHRRYLARGGCIICSIPNAGHISVVKNLLAGKWEYQPCGIMDRTHLRFFTLAEMRTMLENAGFSVNQVNRVEASLDKEEEILLQKLKASGAATEEFIQGAAVIQYLLVAAPAEQANVANEEPSIRDSGLEARPTLSLCMIVKNEEEYLPRCLASVRGVADEIIVVDTGSTDRTVEIAQGFGAKVYHHPWRGDFSEARNVSLEHATGDWILFLDADEELVEEDREKLRELLNDRFNEGFYLNEINFVGDEPGLEAVLNMAFRLFRNRKEYRFTGAIHEQIVACVQRHNPNIGFSQVRINHYGYLKKPSVEKNKVSRNLEILLQEVGKNPRDNFTRFNLGVEYMRLGQYDKALEQYQKAFHKLPSLEVAYASVLVRNIALCLNQLKRHKEALKVLADALQAYPDYTDLVFLKGLVYLEMKRYREAADTFQECLRRGESGQRHITQQGVGGYKAWLALGDTYVQLGDEGEAVKAYTRAMKANTRFPVPVHRLASLLLPREEVEEVKAFFARYLDLESKEVLLNLSQAFARERKYGDALAYLDELITREGKTANLAFTRGECLLNLKRYPEAVAEFEAVPPESQYFYPALLEKAFCHLLEGQYARVSQDLAVVADSPLYYVHSLNYQHLLRLLSGERPQKVVFAQKEDRDKFAALTWDALGKLLELQEFEAFEKSLAILKEIEDPAKPLKLGKLYHRCGYLESAVEELLRAVQEGIFDSEALAILGEACREKGLLEDAEAFYNQAVALDPDQVKYYTTLTSVLAQQRKYEQAKEVARLGIRKFPTSELLKASLQTLEMAAGLTG